MNITDIEQDYLKLRQTVDLQIDQCMFRCHSQLHCKPGCADCCINFSLSLLEAQVVRSALSNSKDKIRLLLRSDQTGESAACPLLSDDRCLIYPDRPIICRTQGLPLGYVDHEQAAIQLSLCEQNDDNERQWEPDDLLMMDPINEQLWELNCRYARLTNQAPTWRIPLLELVHGLLFHEPL